VLALRKDRQLVEVFGEPRSVLGDANKAVLDQRSLRVQPGSFSDPKQTPTPVVARSPRALTARPPRN
jgi:hypothetical protein